MHWPFHSFLSQLRRQIRFFGSGLNSARYVTSAPSPQNALDIFEREWWSRLPRPFANLRAGELNTFEDPRITWAISEFGDAAGRSALELGPLEGGHSYMLERAGFESIIAIEANPRSYLKCLIVKETLGLCRTRFLCGDFVEYLRNSPPHFDAVLASGVLYHMVEPVELIALVSRVTRWLFLWTHYYDGDLLQRNPKVRARFTGEQQFSGHDFECLLFRYRYGGSFTIGGARSYAHWMRRDDIMRCLKHFGFTNIRTGFETPDHANGPAFALVANKD